MRVLLCVSMVAAMLPAVVGVSAQEKPKDVVVKRLARADLEKLEGVWELKAEPKGGWKGTVRATISLYPVDSKMVDFGKILFEYDLADGANKLKGANTPLGGIRFAGVRRGKSDALVTAIATAKERLFPMPFKVVPSDDLTAAFEVTDGKLTLDLSKSKKAFLFEPISDLQIDWSKAVWEKVKVPTGTIYLDLDSKGNIQVPDEKQLLRSVEKKYLAGKFPSASDLVKKAEGNQARPVALIRVREPVEAKRIETLRKVCNEAGYRWGVDIDINADSLRKLSESSPGYVTLTLNEKGEATVVDRKEPLRTLDEIRKYLKEQAPRVRAEGVKAKVDDAPLIQVLGPEKLLQGELVKMLSAEDEKLGYNGYWYFWIHANMFALEEDVTNKK